MMLIYIYIYVVAVMGTETPACHSGRLIPGCPRWTSFLYNPRLLQLVIIGVSLETISFMKLFGVTIQDNLKWNEQVEHMISNALRHLYTSLSSRRMVLNLEI